MLALFVHRRQPAVNKNTENVGDASVQSELEEDGTGMEEEEEGRRSAGHHDKAGHTK